MFKIAFVNGVHKQCGVYQYGLRFAKCLAQDPEIQLDYHEVSSLADYAKMNEQSICNYVIVNYHSSLFTWLSVHHERPDKKYFYMFHEHISFHGVPPHRILDTDPTGTSGKGIPVPRPLALNPNAQPKPPRDPESLVQCPVIGSFGFGFSHKHYDRIIHLVQEQFDSAIIRLQMPFPHYGDKSGAEAREVAAMCQRAITKPGIKLQVNHDFLTDEELCSFLAENDLNIFMYEKEPGRGCASVLDFALCVDRPIAISDSFMYRHIYSDDICVYKTPLKTILSRGAEMHKQYADKWSSANLCKVIKQIVIGS